MTPDPLDRRARELLALASSEDRPPRAGFEDRVMARVRREGRREEGSPFGEACGRLLLPAAAAAVILAVAAGLVISVEQPWLSERGSDSQDVATLTSLGGLP